MRRAGGGTASTFSPVGRNPGSTKREAARRRRQLQRRNRELAEAEPPDFGRSERATFVAWHDWLATCPESALRRSGAAMADTATEILDRMEREERAELEATLPQLRERIDDVARQWHATAVGEQLAIEWDPVSRARDRR